MRLLLPTLAAALAMPGCTPLGQPVGDRGDGPDAGRAGAACDDPTHKAIDLTISPSVGYDDVPGGCWRLDGRLTVSGAITSLSMLGDLRGVSELVIDGTDLARLDLPDGLEVTGAVTIRNNPQLADLEGLRVPGDASCLTYLERVTVEDNAALTDLGGLAALTCVSGPVEIRNNVRLSEIALDRARRLEGGLEIRDNTALTRVSVGAVESITGDLVLHHNAALTEIAPLSQLRFLHGSLIVTDNDALTGLAAMLPATPIAIEGALTITDNATLTDLGAVARVQRVYGLLTIARNAQLDFCPAREVGCCVPHTGYAQIYDNRTSSCSQGHSWCWAQAGNTCPYAY